MYAKLTRMEETPQPQQGEQIRQQLIAALSPDPGWRALSIAKDVATELRQEIIIREAATLERFESMERAVKVQHDDYVRVPTLLQTAIGSVEVLLNSRLENAISKVEGRVEKYTEVMQITRHDIEALLPLLDEKIKHMQAVNDEKFESIKAQFVEKDKATEKLGAADKTALAAALQTQKESAAASTETILAAQNKMEVNFATLIRQGQDLLSAFKLNSDEKINDLKSRIDRGDGKTAGISMSWAILVGAAGLILTVLVIGGIVFASISRNSEKIERSTGRMETAVKHTP